MLSLAALAYILLQSLVVPALPTIGEELGTTQSTVSWILTAYLLSASVATPILGRFGDIYGKKRMLVMVLASLVVGSVVAATTDSIAVMIVARIIQGGGGAIFPLAFSIIRDELPRSPGRRRHRPDLGHHRHRRGLRDRAGRPDRRQPLLPLAVLDPGRSWP